MEALIIRHLVDFEEAFRCAYKLDDEIWEELGNAARKWAEEKGWDFDIDLEEDEFWTAPKSWKLPKESTENTEQDYLAYFEFDGAPDDDWEASNPNVDYLAVTRLCRATKRGMLGFRWKPSYFTEGNKVAWRKFMEKPAERIAQDTGLTYENKSGRFYLQTIVDLETLAKAIEDDAIEDALIPIRSTLDSLAAAVPTLTELLLQAKKQFKK
jgi:hypothetical protein